MTPRRRESVRVPGGPYTASSGRPSTPAADPGGSRWEYVNVSTTRLSLISVVLVVFAAACTTPETTGPSSGSAGAGGTGGGGPGEAGNGGTTGTAGDGVAGTGGGGPGAGGSGGTDPAGTGGGNVAGAAGTGPAGAGGASAGRGGVGGGAAGRGGATGGGTGGAAPAGSSGSEPRLITSGENAYWQTGTVMDLTSGTADLTLNESSLQQTWDGFGGTFNEAGWDAMTQIDAAERDRAIRLLFSQTEGLRFTYGRIPIGASDYAINRYTLNDTANDYQMTSFSLARDRMRLIPYIKAAQAVNPNIKMWGSPWTPPPWMKTNNAYDRGNMKTDAQTLEALALYLAMFVEEYGKEGIPIWAVHPQNEPGYLQDYPSCGWTGSQMAGFIKTHLGPMFMRRNITAEIWMGTLSNPSVDPPIAMAVMSDTGARPFIKGFGMQWGARSSVSSFNSMYGLPIMQSEHQCGNFPNGQANYNSTPAPNNHAYGQESWGLLRDWINAGVRSYLAWNMVLDTMGTNLDRVRQWNQNALLVVDRSARRLIITPTYHVFRHLAGFVDPGARRIGTSGSFGSEVLAFKNPDGSVVAVLYNSGTAARTVTVQIRSGVLARFSIPARGWATLNQP
jgi:glucosylceramidase